MIPQLSLAFLLAAAPAAPAQAPSPAAVPASVAEDFAVTVGEVARNKRTVRLTLAIANRVKAKRLFIHAEPGEEGSILFVPSAPAKGAPPDRTTHFLPTGGASTLEATLLFPMDEEAKAAILVVGEAVSPYRQASVRVDLSEAGPIVDPTPAPTPEPPPAAPGERVIARYKPPVSALGAEIVLKDGTAGPAGHGWIRIYTELPDVSLDQVATAIARPTQVWMGPGGLMFIARLSASRAIALTVRDGAIVTGQMIDQSTYAKLVGPRTPFPSRIFVGK